MNVISLLVWERGSLRPYNGSPLHGGIDFYAWRVRGSALVCVAAVRPISTRRVDELSLFREIFYHLKNTEGVRALEISRADELGRRDIAAIFQGFNGRPIR